MTVTEPDELYLALVRERYETPRLAPTHPAPAASRGTGIPDQHRQVAYLLKLADYGWTARQIAAVTEHDEVYVTQALARWGRRPALEEGLAA